MTVRSGELIDLITFQKKVRTYDGEVETVTWVDDFQEWADGQRLAEQISKYRIHYRRGITPDTHRVIAFDSIWSITNVLPDPRFTELQIECDWSAMVEVTHLKSPRREWIPGLPAVAQEVVTEEDEFMNPITTDITSQISFPQAGVSRISGALVSVVIGKLIILTWDWYIVIPDSTLPSINVQLPAGLVGKTGISFASAHSYARNTLGTAYIQPPNSSILQIVSGLPLYGATPDPGLHFMSQISYVTN